MSQDLSKAVLSPRLIMFLRHYFINMAKHTGADLARVQAALVALVRVEDVLTVLQVFSQTAYPFNVRGPQGYHFSAQVEVHLSGNEPDARATRLNIKYETVVNGKKAIRAMAQISVLGVNMAGPGIMIGQVTAAKADQETLDIIDKALGQPDQALIYHLMWAIDLDDGSDAAMVRARVARHLGYTTGHAELTVLPGAIRLLQGLAVHVDGPLGLNLYPQLAALLEQQAIHGYDLKKVTSANPALEVCLKGAPSLAGNNLMRLGIELRFTGVPGVAVLLRPQTGGLTFASDFMTLSTDPRESVGVDTLALAKFKAQAAQSDDCRQAVAAFTVLLRTLLPLLGDASRTSGQRALRLLAVSDF